MSPEEKEQWGDRLTDPPTYQQQNEAVDAILDRVEALEAELAAARAAPPRPEAIVVMPAKHSEAGIHAFERNVEATGYWVRWAHCGAEIHSDCNYTWHAATPAKEGKADG